MDEETTAGSVLSKIIIAIFILAVADLAVINWLVLRPNNNAGLGELGVVGNSQVSPVGSPLPSSPALVIDQAQQPSEASPSPSPDASASHAPDTTSKISAPVVVQNQYKEIFIPLGSGSTKNSSFSDLYGVEVTVDTTKYSEIDYMTFEASVSVDGGNGTAWAQIKNVSDNNPLIESQISNSTSTPTLKNSGKIPFVSGSKTYRVQAKTDLTEFAAHVDNARLKIVLK